MIAKLDTYDYDILSDGLIQIRIQGNTDPDLVDIMSEIDRADGRIFVEEKHYVYQDYKISRGVGCSYLELYVVPRET